MQIKTLEQLAAAKAEVKMAYGVDVDVLEAKDLFNQGLAREVKDVLHYDLLARRCSK